MELKELRIGNNIYYTKGWNHEPTERVVKVSTDLLKEIQRQKYSSVVKPIPLTEEWLVKFGFRKKERKMDKNHNFDLNISKHYVLRVNQGEIYIPYIGWSGKKYVHQLQNLYFALTGEELTIKD